MAEFVLFAFEFPTWLPADLGLPAMIGAGSALALILGLVLDRSFRRRPKPAPPPAPPEPPKPAVDPFEVGSAAEKRNSARRKGSPVKVQIRVPQVIDAPVDGWVLDRSSCGLGFCTTTEFATGTHLQVRAESDEGPWLELEVRHARFENGEWHIGCQFIETPSWSLLLQFR